MSNLALQDVFEPYYEGRDGLSANAARDGTVHTLHGLARREERRTVQAPPITPPAEETARR